jgi:hypothetical protein
MPSGVPFPEIRFSSWKNAELADPVGTRHLVSGSFAFDKVVGIGCASSMPFNNLRLNLGNNDPFVGSNVAVINISVPNFGELQSSGLSTIYNMKLWIPSGSGAILDLPGSHLQFETSGTWLPNLTFPSGAGQAFLRALPTQFNVRRIDGRPEILSFNDANVSEWIYMRLFLDASFPVGSFGACGSGTFRPRLTYDFY